MRVVFMGTPRIAVTVLEKIASFHDVVGVFTRPDAVRGRGKALVPSDVKAAALEMGIPVFEARTLADAGALEVLRDLAPDVVCVVAYSALLPKEALEIPRYGCLNVHTSLLPRWRGAAPMERAILAGDRTVGVSIMRMEEGLDTGAFCKQGEIEAFGMCRDEMEETLGRLGAELLVEALGELENGSCSWTAQAGSLATYAEKIGKGELDLDPESPCLQAWACVRASSDAHPSHAVLAGKQVTVEKASPVQDEAGLALVQDLAAGDLAFRAKRLFIGFEDGALEVAQLKPQGKKSMDARAFCAGIQGIKNSVMKWERV